MTGGITSKFVFWWWRSFKEAVTVLHKHKDSPTVMSRPPAAHITLCPPPAASLHKRPGLPPPPPLPPPLVFHRGIRDAALATQTLTKSPGPASWAGSADFAHKLKDLGALLLHSSHLASDTNPGFGNKLISVDFYPPPTHRPLTQAPSGVTVQDKLSHEPTPEIFLI